MQTLDAHTKAALIQAIDFALGHKVRAPGRWRDCDQRRAAAQAIADHLLLANFEVRSGPPAPPAGLASQRLPEPRP